MKVLIATPMTPPHIGGPATYSVHLEKEFKSMGHEVTLVTFSDVLAYPRGIRHLMFFFRICRSFRHAHVAIGLDTMSVALPLIMATIVCKKKSIIRVGGDYVWERYIERTKEKVLLSDFYSSGIQLRFFEKVLIWIQKYLIFPHTDVIVFSTPWQKKIWDEPYALTHRQTVIIENAYPPTVQKKELRTHDPMKVVWVGRNIVLKNVETLERAIAIVQKDFPDVHLEKYSNSSHREVIDALSSCRMLVVPSLSEVSPNIVYEAQSLTVPVLLTYDCGLREKLGDAVTWIDPLDSEDIASKIRTLLTSDGYTNVMQKGTHTLSSRTYRDVAEDFIQITSGL